MFISNVMDLMQLDLAIVLLSSISNFSSVQAKIFGVTLDLFFSHTYKQICQEMVLFLCFTASRSSSYLTISTASFDPSHHNNFV